MSLVTIVITLIVVGVLLWLVNTYIPMDGKIKKILNTWSWWSSSFGCSTYLEYSVTSATFASQPIHRPSACPPAAWFRNQAQWRTRWSRPRLRIQYRGFRPIESQAWLGVDQLLESSYTERPGRFTLTGDASNDGSQHSANELVPMSNTAARYLHFFWAHLVKHGQTGGIVPSQRFLIAKMISPVPETYRGQVIELGAGSGALTLRLAAKCPEARMPGLSGIEPGPGVRPSARPRGGGPQRQG